MIAHIAGLPAEEMLLPLVGGGGVALIAARAWAARAVERLRRRG
jgi:hypothetical protein